MLTLMLATAFASEDVAISVHLHEVVDTLRIETPADLSPRARQRRLDLLDVLEGYAAAGDFPEHPPGPAPRRVHVPPRAFDGGIDRAPVFVDEEGTHCAVGFLMALDAPALLDQIAGTANDAWVPDLSVPGVAEWARAHGFTADELAWIQPTYDFGYYERWVGACPAEDPPFEPVDVDGNPSFIGRLEVCPDVVVRVVHPRQPTPWCAESCNHLVGWFQLYNDGDVPVSFYVGDVGASAGQQVALDADQSTVVGPFSALAFELTPTSCAGDPIQFEEEVNLDNGGRLCVLGCVDLLGCDGPPTPGLEPVTSGCGSEAGGCNQGGGAPWWMWLGLWLPMRRRR